MKEERGEISEERRDGREEIKRKGEMEGKRED